MENNGFNVSDTPKIDEFITHLKNVVLLLKKWLKTQFVLD